MFEWIMNGGGTLTVGQIKIYQEVSLFDTEYQNGAGLLLSEGIVWIYSGSSLTGSGLLSTLVKINTVNGNWNVVLSNVPGVNTRTLIPEGGGKIGVVGGSNSSEGANNYRYDIATNSHVRTRGGVKQPTPMDGRPSTIYNARAYYINTDTGSSMGRLNVIDSLNNAGYAGSSSNKPGHPRLYACCTVGNKLYFHGGGDGRGISTFTEVDPVTADYVRLPTGPYMRGHTITQHGGWIYVLGGDGEFHRYHITGQTWEQLPTIEGGIKLMSDSSGLYGYLNVGGKIGLTKIVVEG